MIERSTIVLRSFLALVRISVGLAVGDQQEGSPASYFLNQVEFEGVAADAGLHRLGADRGLY